MLLPSWDGLDTEGSQAGPWSVPDVSQRCGYDYSSAGVTTEDLPYLGAALVGTPAPCLSVGDLSLCPLALAPHLPHL